MSEIAPGKVAPESSTKVRFNHQTFPALGLLFAGQYFTRYYHAVEGEDWIRLADGTFIYQLDAEKPHCDCNGYQWLTLRHVVEYCLARPNLKYLENGNLRKNADYAILTFDNLGYPVAYGDVGGWSSWAAVPILMPAGGTEDGAPPGAIEAARGGAPDEVLRHPRTPCGTDRLLER